MTGVAVLNNAIVLAQDEAGAAIADAKIVVQNSNITFTGSTDSTGKAFFNLDYGTYQITATAQNHFKYEGDFKVTSLDNFTVNALLPQQGVVNRFQLREDPSGSTNVTSSSTVVNTQFSSISVSPSVIDLNDVLLGNFPQIVLTIKNTGKTLIFQLYSHLYKVLRWLLELH